MCQYIRAYASEGLGSHFQMHSDSSHVLPRELDKLAQSPLTSYWLHIWLFVLESAWIVFWLQILSNARFFFCSN